MTRTRTHVRARLGLARTFQRLELFSTLSATDNVRVGLEASGRAAASAAVDLLERVGVGAAVSAPVSSLPTGMARLVELAPRPVHRPQGPPARRAVLGARRARDRGARTTAQLSRRRGPGRRPGRARHRPGPAGVREVHVLDFGQVIATGTPRGPAQPGRAGGLPRPRQRAGHEAGPPGGRGHMTARRACRWSVRAAYGRIEVLHGVDLRSRTAPFRPARPQRGGQEHAVQGDRRAHAPHRRHGRDRRCRRPPDPRGTGARRRDRHPRGPRGVPQPHGARQPAHVDLPRGRHHGRGGGARLRAVPPPQGPARQLAGTLSGGEQQMLAISRALAGETGCSSSTRSPWASPPSSSASSTSWWPPSRLAASRWSWSSIRRDGPRGGGPGGHHTARRVAHEGTPPEMADAAVSVYL